MKIAALDIGTNTALLLIAEISPEHGTLKSLYNAQEIVRLGQGVDADRKIQPEAKERLYNALMKFQKLIKLYDVKYVVAVGTSALRDAKNSAALIREMDAKTGIEIKVITGDEEAEMTFLGAITGIAELPKRFLVMDIGGGSTEFILGRASSQLGARSAPVNFDVEDQVSVDMGSVRMTERFFKSLPPSKDDVEAARQAFIKQLSPKVGKFIAGREMMIAVAGTATTVAQLALGLKQFSANDIQGYNVKYDEAHSLYQTILTKTPSEIEEMGVSPGRADVLPAGLLIFHQAMRLFSLTAVKVSIQGLRYGVVLKELERLRLMLR
ncbi:MAG: Ppx/GppA phosphatase family protein [Chloroherpetonaceae bacterium]|nr:Ppx/GppA phosphatase family protein [Chloroherpetonaceae bacterium]